MTEALRLGRVCDFDLFAVVFFLFFFLPLKALFAACSGSLVSNSPFMIEENILALFDRERFCLITAVVLSEKGVSGRCTGNVKICRDDLVFRAEASSFIGSPPSEFDEIWFSSLTRHKQETKEEACKDVSHLFLDRCSQDDDDGRGAVQAFPPTSHAR